MSAATAVAPGTTAHVRRARRARQVRVGVVLAVLVLVACGVSLCLGEAAVAPADVLRALVGQADELTHFVIFDLRLPRLETGLLVGACLGVSGGSCSPWCGTRSRAPTSSASRVPRARQA
ncbi:hypothetical protein GCM10025864_32140 [Luteimicrobium album]|uniref:Uncharacterized protein n=1 Tax=Luteimicrobium album TaxID=1054550 RepID=A0ABQ6I6R8_9MICO|nr:iron chelate uptake ABC transporter family permease subunit [Luteimicrobium album]GMA25455.1 hypothetical protein GCM10025864_32140 [Luteimicrobium album]